jgi:hypothetical protein
MMRALTAATSLRACSSVAPDARRAMRASFDHERTEVMVADGHVEQRIDPVREERRGLQHADDGHRPVVQRERGAEHCRVSCKALQPELVRQHDDRRHAGAVIGRTRQASEHGAQSHDVEVVPRHQPHVDALGAGAGLQREIPR